MTTPIKTLPYAMETPTIEYWSRKDISPPLVAYTPSKASVLPSGLCAACMQFTEAYSCASEPVREKMQSCKGAMVCVGNAEKNISCSGVLLRLRNSTVCLAPKWILQDTQLGDIELISGLIKEDNGEIGARANLYIASATEIGDELCLLHLRNPNIPYFVQPLEVNALASSSSGTQEAVLLHYPQLGNSLKASFGVIGDRESAPYVAEGSAGGLYIGDNGYCMGIHYQGRMIPIDDILIAIQTNNPGSKRSPNTERYPSSLESSKERKKLKAKITPLQPSSETPVAKMNGKKLPHSTGKENIAKNLFCEKDEEEDGLLVKQTVRRTNGAVEPGLIIDAHQKKHFPAFSKGGNYIGSPGTVFPAETTEKDLQDIALAIRQVSAILQACPVQARECTPPKITLSVDDLTLDKRVKKILKTSGYGCISTHAGFVPEGSFWGIHFFPER